MINLLFSRNQAFFLSIVILIMLQSGTVNAQNYNWQKYSNLRFKYEFEYPSLLLKPLPESDNGDGRKFVSLDNQTFVIIYGTHFPCSPVQAERLCTLNQTYEEHQKNWLVEGGSITYQTKNSNYFVITGYLKNKIFYEKTIVINGEGKTFQIIYPTAQRNIWDKVTEKLFSSFKTIQ